MGDAEYMSAFYQIIMPIAIEYQPELIIVSSGFDSGEGDPIVCTHIHTNNVKERVDMGIWEGGKCFVTDLSIILH